MKKYLNKFKEGLILGTGILVAFSIGTFAYSKIETVKSGDVLSADSYNKLVDRINDLELQNEGIYQNAFDTNEIWTGRYDTLTGKKIYSKWYDLGKVGGGQSGEKTIKHGIPGIEEIITVEQSMKRESDSSVFSNWTHHGIRVNSTDLVINYTTVRGPVWFGWVRLEYTKIDE